MDASKAKVYEGGSSVTKVMIAIAAAAVYGAGLWVTGFLPTIPGVSWIRPANMLSELFAVNFGYAGSIGVMLGNEFGDILTGHFNPTQLWWLLPLELIGTALVVFWGVTDPSLRTTRGKIEWLVFAVVLQGLITGFGIAFFLVLQGTIPQEALTTVGTTITLNEAIPAVVAGFVQYLLFPFIVKMDLWYGRNLKTSNVPKDLLAELQK